MRILLYLLWKLEGNIFLKLWCEAEIVASPKATSPQNEEAGTSDSFRVCRPVPPRTIPGHPLSGYHYAGVSAFLKRGRVADVYGPGFG
ncbi:hypothetical protein Y1Q_0000441 [Alligator mississippiensis]|uniref:Uncharacterized protein n=1 Tax=Alligator mississippiensis TaxID=8496 RepID=A0A151MB43_ALLMI|nr:hypothetical protein Y1Q_0000441 [Alligator mississippiensis]